MKQIKFSMKHLNEISDDNFKCRYNEIINEINEIKKIKHKFFVK